MVFEELLCDVAFVPVHGRSDAVFWMERAQEVYMVDVCSQLFDFKVKSLFKFMANSVERAFDVFPQKRFSILHRKY